MIAERAGGQGSGGAARKPPRKRRGGAANPHTIFTSGCYTVAAQTREASSLNVRAQLLAGLLSALPASGGETPARAPRVEDFAPPEEFVRVGGIRTHVARRGEAGRPIVLIHGFGANTYTWRLNLDGLGERFRVFAPDLKGFGLTEKPRDGRYHLRAYAGHLLGFLDELRLERPILVGNSMGGSVALLIALEHPGRIGGLVLVDAAPLDPWVRPVGPGAEGVRRGLRADPILFRALVTRALVERGLRSSFRDPGRVTPEMVEAYYPTTIDGAAEAMAAMLDPPPEAAPRNLPPLSELKVPVLIVWGRHDRAIPAAEADRFAAAIPGARKAILEDSAHLPHEEQPELFNRLVSEFAAGLP